MPNLSPVSLIGARASGSPLGKAAPLSQREKAAIVVRFLLSEGAEVTLTDLPDDLQSELAVLFGSMRHVDRATLANVVSEFAEELEQIALLFPRSMTGALSALDGRISPQTAARLRKEAGVRQSGDPWDQLRAIPVEAMLPFLTSEATEVAAVILSKLEVAKSADLLGRLPGTTARRIAYAMSKTGAVTPETVYRIGLSLALQLDSSPDRAFADDPEKRVGAILNLSTSEMRDDVLSGLDEEDQTFAEGVRRAIFTFANIPVRVDPRDAPKVIRNIDQGTLVEALVYATAQGGDMALAANFILDNISTRLADGLREEMSQSGKVKAKAGEAAMTAIIVAIRDLEATGELTLLSPQSDQEEE